LTTCTVLWDVQYFQFNYACWYVLNEFLSLSLFILLRISSTALLQTFFCNNVGNHMLLYTQQLRFLGNIYNLILISMCGEWSAIACNTLSISHSLSLPICQATLVTGAPCKIHCNIEMYCLISSLPILFKECILYNNLNLNSITRTD